MYLPCFINKKEFVIKISLKQTVHAEPIESNTFHVYEDRMCHFSDDEEAHLVASSESLWCRRHN